MEVDADCLQTSQLQTLVCSPVLENKNNKKNGNRFPTFLLRILLRLRQS